MTNKTRLLELIERNGISYGVLSERTGIPKSALQRYATGDTIKIPAERAEVLARELGSTAAYILGLVDDTLRLLGYHVVALPRGMVRIIDETEPERHIDITREAYDDICTYNYPRDIVEQMINEKPTPANGDGLSEEKRKLIAAVREMSDDDVRRLRVIVDQVILLRGE